MTQERYIVLMLQVISHVLVYERDVDLLEVTGEQAWNAFLVVLAREPHGELAQYYYAFGLFCRHHFGVIWSAFQADVYRALCALEGV